MQMMKEMEVMIACVKIHFTGIKKLLERTVDPSSEGTVRCAQGVTMSEGGYHEENTKGA